MLSSEIMSVTTFYRLRIMLASSLPLLFHYHNCFSVNSEKLYMSLEPKMCDKIE